MSEWEDQYLPLMGVVLMQLIYSIMNLLNKAALVEGMSPRVFVFYRQAIATLFICPVAYFKRDSSSNSPMQIRSFLWILITAFVGVALYPNLNTEGLYLASASASSAMSNLVPAITFVIAVTLRLEKMNVRRISSIAKILGTAICITGAISITLLKGQKLLNVQLFQQFKPVLSHLLGDQNWLLGCIFLFASYTCWSLYLILQVAVTNCYSNHLSLSAWMCFISMLQTGVIALVLERNKSDVWAINSFIELSACSFSGIFGSALAYFIQSWCISRKGPVFFAMFNPLSTVITTVLAAIFLHEEVYLGSLLGSIAVIIGLYCVLWGKKEEIKENTGPRDSLDATTDLEEPLLIDNASVQNICNQNLAKPK